MLFRKSFTPEEIAQRINQRSARNEQKRQKAVAKVCDKITRRMAKYKISEITVYFYRRDRKKGNILNIHVESNAVQVAVCDELQKRGFYVDNYEGLFGDCYKISV